MNWTKVIALIVAVFVGYAYAATRNWVWYPKWLKAFVFDEKKK